MLSDLRRDALVVSHKHHLAAPEASMEGDREGKGEEGFDKLQIEATTQRSRAKQGDVLVDRCALNRAIGPEIL